MSILDLYGHCIKKIFKFDYKIMCMSNRSELKSNFDLVQLPPTSEIAHQLSSRVNIQVQVWVVKNIQPTNWVWKSENVEVKEGPKKVLRPVRSTKTFAPDDLLNLLSDAEAGNQD